MDRFPGKDMPRWNFTDFMHSFMMIFRVLCGEWIEVMWDCLLVGDATCIPFFMATVIIGNLVVTISIYLSGLSASVSVSINQFHRYLFALDLQSFSRHFPVIFLSFSRHFPVIFPSFSRHFPVIVPS